MKKRILIVLLVLVLLPIVVSAETGVGAAFFLGEDGFDGAALNISHPKIPGTILGIRANFGEDMFMLGIYDDWWLYHGKLGSALNLYLGPGFFVSMYSVDDETDADFGGRLPIGLRFFPIKPIELFIEIVPTLGVYPTLPTFGFMAAAGIRFWF